MHIPVSQARRIDDGESAVDLGQSPGDIVVLSAADTELAGFAGAVEALGAVSRGGLEASVRLASLMALGHPYSVDLYVEKTISHARLVFVRLLGGKGYWPYGLERLGEAARANGFKLIVVAGDDKWDETLAAHSTVSPEIAERLWRYCVEGGAENLRHALRYAGHLIGEGGEPPLPRPLPRAGLWWPDMPSPTLDDVKARWSDAARPAAAIVFYRALVQGAATAPVASLIEELNTAGVNAMPVFVASLKEASSAAVLAGLFSQTPPDIVLNATAFALSSAAGGFRSTVLDAPGRPVLQVVFSSSSEDGWRESERGLSIRDLAMHVVLPELDGRLFTRAVSFKEAGEQDARTQSTPVRFAPKTDRVRFVAELAGNWAKLGRKSPAQRKVALLLANYPNKDGRIANGVGLDTPASTVAILKAMEGAGYAVRSVPTDSDALMAEIAAGPTNAPKPGRAGGELLELGRYAELFARLPETVRKAVIERWGVPEADPFVVDGAFRLAVHRYGAAVVAIQPARGYNIDPKETYHAPDLVPPHFYFATYLWLREEFGIDAVVHVGKHGNLEWLPGKALALSQDCYPEAVLGPVPNLYPFIVNDPGEGSQAKRRLSSVIIDHLTPPMTRAESHGVAVEMESLLDEYYLASGIDPRRMEALEEAIFDLAARNGLDVDVGITRDMERADRLTRIDAHLCDLKELQIRDGLHVLGFAPQGVQLRDLLVALARVPRGSAEDEGSLHRAIAADLGLMNGPAGDRHISSSPRAGAVDGRAKVCKRRFDPLDCDMAAPWDGPKPELLAQCCDNPWRTAGDTVERIEMAAADLIENPDKSKSYGCLTTSVLTSIVSRLKKSVEVSGDAELAALLCGLDGRFVAPGPSGAPTRGRPDVLPTGRNFFSVDVRAVPSELAWRLGRLSAERLAERYFEEEGEWPSAIALTAWGTSNMRTGGDDIAQALALIGVSPVWEPGSGRVTGFEVVPLSQLGRPRIDVTLRISGFFRDAFPHQIDLFDSAVRAVSELSEPEDANPLAARVGAEARRLEGEGIARDAARRRASFRVFGSMPGAYGAGLQALVDEGIWDERGDFADAYLTWGAYAYGGGAEGACARAELETRLRATDAVVHNQDNREHDLLDSDDYYQFEGGLAATVETLKGEAPRVFHNDHSRPERPVVRTLEEEIARVVRGRAANPKWITGVMRHGYKGAFEIAATVDYLYAFAATTHAVKDHHFDQLYTAYLEDDVVRDFIAEKNPAALSEIAERLRDAIERGLWRPRLNSAYDHLSRLAQPAEENA
ncbi:cobaltochelatase CobN subunit [Breoghania corrubedonensis]|uniref:Cobaltochelatase subunit CobN n=1 Tax=Breoghania corrubedonensis TaxID=665038 RepID=A0A2T5V9I0_9HYPH|nr:cobaltochelatase subunit CobN [Breoghania corrubedonensis]PTW60391.1 cobaltochelatase CobN subunit [Breoghania corrubedonensis]